MATCRSCRDEILWAVTESGRRIPLDPDPVRDGNVVFVGKTLADGTPIVKVLNTVNQPGGLHVDLELYKSHFATCPDAKRWRQP